jgi:hypothetical protein
MQKRGDSSEDIQRRILADRIEFDVAKIKGLDLIIDTSEISLSDLADEIYQNYRRLLVEKNEGYRQLSLFSSDSEGNH